ncbi:MAG: HlyD family secretion protein [Anaerolineales bacterium]
MKLQKLRTPVSLVLACGVMIAALVYLTRVSAASPGVLTASGSVEAEAVIVAPENAGRVKDVLVEAGDAVRAGQVLFRLDDEHLQTQRQKVEAAGQAAVAAAWLGQLHAQQAFDDLMQNWKLQSAQKELALAQARKALDDAQRRRTYQQSGNRATQDTIKATQADLVLAQDAVDKAQEVFNRLKDRPTVDLERAAAEALLAGARKERDALQATLNWYQGSPSDIDQAILDAQVSVATASLTDAEKEWDKWKEGPAQIDLELAEAALGQAQSQLALAKAQAAADLDSIDTQIENLSIKAPIDGVVLERTVEPGEVLVPGSQAFRLADLSSLKITVFIAEDQYGSIMIGAPAAVTVDSFPGITFEASVSRIADQAEFTPRNVQTEEGRKTMVFAVELRVVDPEGRLKPGMPADVTFLGT